MASRHADGAVRLGTSGGDGQIGEPSARRQAPDWIVLTLACVAQFMVILDVSIVNVALPSIGRELHYSPTGLQWVVNAYVLTFAGFLLLGGRAGDLYGRRRVYLAGLGLFTLASLIGGFAQNTAWLTTARAVQGVGGAVLSPVTLTIILTTFSGVRLARALGLWAAVGGGGAAVGVILGGVLTSELSWRWVLFINVPIGAAAAIAAVMFLTESRRIQGHRLDVAGAITATGGLALLAYAIVSTDEHPWGSAYTISLLAAAAVVLGVFVLIERRVAASSTPLVPFRLFRSRSVNGANIVMFFVGAGFFSMWYFLSLYLQDALHYDALKTGFAFVPMAIMIMASSQFSSRLLPRLGPRPLMVAGALAMVGSFVWLSRIESTSTYWSSVFGPGLLVTFAIGLLFTPLASAGTAGVAQADAGLASGVLNTSRQVGGSLGLAVLATIASSHTRALLATSHVSGAAALTAGFTKAFEVAAVLAAVAFVGSFVVPRVSRPSAPAATATDATSSRASSAPLPAAETTEPDAPPRPEESRVVRGGADLAEAPE